ncbi:MAG TPA: divergent polysaccharide deacetylase family protein [Candidatus Eisenbacteria bacterium]|jgi:polysaccharide deacetylase 2 family uncharacterized protein YibQ
MPRRKTRTTAASLRAPLLLAAATLALFLSGEALLLLRSDSGQIALMRVLGLGDPNRVTQIVSRELRQAMRAIGVPDDSLRVSVAESAPAVVWRMGFPAEASLLRANYILTHFVEQHGARVLSGREREGPEGETVVTLVVGLPRHPTHRVVLVRAPPPVGDERAAAPRLAIVLYGFGDDTRLAAEFFALPAPFAVALAPGGKASAALFRDAHARGREVVLHLPLEPINYPQVDPGPGTVLVTMPPARIAALVHRYIEQARPVIAVANHMGSLATQDMTVMKAVYHQLRRSGLPFVHVNPAAGAVCRDLAADLGVAYNEPDAMIDSEARLADPKALDQRWSRLIADARGRERTVVWLRATPLTLRWLAPALQGKRLAGVSLAPLSALIRKPTVL